MQIIYVINSITTLVLHTYIYTYIVKNIKNENCTEDSSYMWIIATVDMYIVTVSYILGYFYDNKIIKNLAVYTNEACK